MEVIKGGKSKSPSKEEKQNIDLEILNLFKWVTDGDKENSVLYMRGDNEYQTASLTIKGDVMLLANTFIHHIEKNVEFGRFITAVFGSYLSKNPDKLKEFLEGIEILKNQIGIN